MEELIISLVTSNINYKNILIVVLLFFAVQWLILSIWIFFDIKYRFKSLIIAIIFTLCLLPFNIPFLILYVLLRPERYEDDNNRNYYTFNNQVVPVLNVNVDDLNKTITVFIKIDELSNTRDNKSIQNVKNQNIDAQNNKDKINKDQKEQSKISGKHKIKKVILIPINLLAKLKKICISIFKLSKKTFFITKNQIHKKFIIKTIKQHKKDDKKVEK
ncbi:MAG: hypothetical protein NZZ41_04585 [Candidatus Dojkabacteria bacterium]|nr:hypothetical protein [Candidatus Dojkabacteria bacterium]